MCKFKERAKKHLTSSHYGALFRGLITQSRAAKGAFVAVMEWLVRKSLRDLKHSQTLAKTMNKESLQQFSWKSVCDEARLVSPDALSFLRGLVLPGIRKRYNDTCIIMLCK